MEFRMLAPLPGVVMMIDCSSLSSSVVAEANAPVEGTASGQPPEKTNSSTIPKPKGRKAAGMKKRPQPKATSPKAANDAGAVERGERDVHTLREHPLIFHIGPAVPVPGSSVNNKNSRIQPDNALGLGEEFVIGRVAPKSVNMTIKVPPCVLLRLRLSDSTDDRPWHAERHNRRQ